MIELPEREAWALLERARVAHLALCSDEGPYINPMSFVFDQGAFAFRTGAGRKVDLLKQHPAVCIEISELADGGAWESVLIWGSAVRVEDKNRRAGIIAALLSKYRSDLGDPLTFSTPQVLPRNEAIFVVPIDRMTGRKSGGLFAPTTRPGRL